MGRRVNTNMSFYERVWNDGPRQFYYRESTFVPKSYNNKKMKMSAENNAYDMRANPSYLEKKMMELLNDWKIKYDFQKIFYMRSKGGFIKNYYIADFYIPKRKIILEVDGQFHKDQIEYDEFRTKDIQKHYPNITVVRWENKDFNSYNNLKTLKELLD